MKGNQTNASERVAQEREALTEFERSRPRQAGFLSPRERVALLVDDDSFFELAILAKSQTPGARDLTPADGAITGFGSVGGAQIGVIADDPVALRHTDGAVGRNKRLRLLAQASHGRIPVVYLADGVSEGATLIGRESVKLYSKFSNGSILLPAIQLGERQWPLVSIVLGERSPQGELLVGCSDVVIASRTSGVSTDDACDILVGSEAEALAAARHFVNLIPRDTREPLEAKAVFDHPELTLPDDVEPASLSCLAVIQSIVDAGSTLSFGTGSESPFTAGFASIQGLPVAFAGAANDGSHGIDLASIEQLRRIALVRKRLNLPMLLVQHGGTYRDDAMHEPAYARAVAETVNLIRDSAAPQLCLITVTGHALGDFVLGGRDIGSDYIVAWPQADVAIQEMEWFTDTAAATRRGLGPWDAAGMGILDDIIPPGETWSRLGRILRIMGPARAFPSVHDDYAGRILGV